MSEIKNHPEEREEEYREYQKYCDSLAPFWSDQIRQEFIEQGVDYLLEIKRLKPDTMVFTDTGARPAALFLKNLWRRIFPNEKFPDIAFISGQRVASSFDIDKSAEEYRRRMSAHKTKFANRRVLVIDEVVHSRATLRNAAITIKEAFPTCTILYSALHQRGYSLTDPPLAVRPPRVIGDVALGERIGVAKARGLKTGLRKDRAISFRESGEEAPVPTATSIAYFAAVGKNQRLNQAEIDKVSALIERVGESKPEERERLVNLKSNFEKLV